MKDAATVRKSIVVCAPQEHVFSAFTEYHGFWWPLETHHIGATVPTTALIEPHVGGRWYEVSAEGTECDWGRVLAWEPYSRIVLSWEISASFKRDPNLLTEVEIRFIAESELRTRVNVEHRLLENYGGQAGTMQSIFDSDAGWSGILARFGRYVDAGVFGERAPVADRLQLHPRSSDLAPKLN